MDTNIDQLLSQLLTQLNQHSQPGVSGSINWNQIITTMIVSALTLIPLYLKSRQNGIKTDALKEKTDSIENKVDGTHTALTNKIDVLTAQNAGLVAVAAMPSTTTTDATSPALLSEAHVQQIVAALKAADTNANPKV